MYFVTFRVKDGSLSPDELKIVFDHILAGNGRFYLLISLVLMPDHGHIIFKSFPQYSLQRVMKGIKGVSSHLVNQSRGTKGTVWQDESYDRIIRNDDDLYEKIRYLFFNPVKKELVMTPEDYPFWYFDDGWNEKVINGGGGSTGIPACGAEMSKG